MESEKKSLISSIKLFPKTFWIANSMELFERMAYYGMFAVLSLYLTNPVAEGALGLTQTQRGTIQAWFTFILYLIPIFAGALADKYGYKKTLIVAFSIYSIAYYISGNVYSYYGIFGALLLVALGGAIFKPIVASTVGRVTTKETSSLGFGIYYMVVNIGGFIGPIIAGIVRGFSWQLVFYASALYTALMLIPTVFLYKDPIEEEKKKGNIKPKSIKIVLFDTIKIIYSPILVVFNIIAKKAGMKLINIILFIILFPWSVIFWKEIKDRNLEDDKSNFYFMIFLLIFSGFWTMFEQIFITLPVFIEHSVDTTPLLTTIKDLFNFIGITSISNTIQEKINNGWQINPEYIINIDSGMIIILQIYISNFVTRFKSLNSMIFGIVIAAIGVGITGLSSFGWIVVLAIVVFSIGEMSASPKFYEYIGNIAPSDKVALYMGYSFIPIAIGNLLAGYMSGHLYEYLARPRIPSGIVIRAEKIDNYEKGFFKNFNDMDGDGIEDSADRCPNKLETINGVDDEDGCSDHGKASYKINEDGNIEWRNIHVFRWGDSKITPTGKKLLSQISLLFKTRQFQDKKMIITGYADIPGDNLENRELAEKRIQSVVSYLNIDRKVQSRINSKIGNLQDTRPKIMLGKYIINGPMIMWFCFTILGLFTSLGLYVYNRFMQNYQIKKNNKNELGGK